MTDKQRATVLVELALAGTEPPREVRLFRAGANRTRKGTFTFDEQSARAVPAAFAEWGVDRLSFDYAHAMLRGASAPDPSEAGKAAGWFKPEVRNGELWAADIEWTPKADAAIRAREFRFVSPAVAHDKDMRVLELLNVALTNIPATKDLPPLVLDDTAVAHEPEHREDTDTMKGLLALLGLSADASEERALGALDALKREVTELHELTGKTGAEALGTVRAWRDGHAKVAALEAERDELRGIELARLIDDATKAGKLTPAQKPWAQEYGAASLKGLRAYLDAAPVVRKLDEERKAPEGGAVASALSADERAVIAQLGIKEDEFIKSREQYAAAAGE